MPSHAIDAVAQVFADAGQPISSSRAARIAGEIAAYDGLDRAIAALLNDRPADGLDDLLAYRAALEEQGDPAARMLRLRRDAQDLDARAESAWAEAAGFHGRAAFRVLQGERILADQFLAHAQACERLAGALEGEAFAKRLQAARLESDAARRSELAGLLRALAA